MNLGIDVASVDGNENIDWNLARSAGPTSFAILRATYGVNVDPDFIAYWNAAKDADLVCGAYAFLEFGSPVTTPSPEDQMAAFLKVIGPTINGSSTNFPPTIDLEIPGGRAATGMTTAQVLDWFLRAHRYVKNAIGVAPMTYTSYVFWVDPDGVGNLPAPELADTQAWVKYWPYQPELLAEHDPRIIDALRAPPPPPPWGNAWTMQQYQGDAIKFPGFSSTIDLSRFNVLRAGMVNDTVKWAQRRLGVVVDGVFGPQTLATVKAFQKSHGLVADGEIGPRTTCPLAWIRPLGA